MEEVRWMVVLFRNVMVESVKSEVRSQAKHARRIPTRKCVEPVTGSRGSAPHLDNGRKNPSKADKWRKLHYKRQHVESLYYYQSLAIAFC